MMNDQKSVSIVIPFFNEKDGINALLKSIEGYYAHRKFDFDIIFVDDGSKDGTGEVIKNIQSFPVPCQLITFSRNFGAHAAVRAGFANSKGDYVTCLPADLQISFDTVEKLLAAATQGNDVVNAVREINQIGLFEKVFSRFYAIMMQKFVSQDFPYEGIETVMISDKVRKVFNENVEANSSFVLQILSMGFKTAFVSIERGSRTIGRSKWTLGKKIKLVVDSFVAFSYAPIRFVTYTGFILFFIGLIWSVYIVIRKFVSDDLAQGWPMLLSILLLGFGITNISLGIIAEYLWRTLDASRRRPVFIIDNIVEINKN